MDAGDDVVEVGSRSLKERNEQGFAQAIDLSQDDPSSDEGAPIGVDANIVEVSDDAAAVSDEEPPPPPVVVPPVADVPAPTPSKLAAFMASTPNPTSPTA